MRFNIRIHKLGFFRVFTLFVMIFSVIRGFVPLLTGNAILALPTYGFSFILGVLLSLFGLYLALFKNNQIVSKQFRLLLFANLVSLLFWWIPVLVFSQSFNDKVAFFYTGLFPFSILCFSQVPEKFIITALKITTVAVAGAVICDYLLLNTNLVPNGYSLAIKYQLLLRPESFVGFGRTGNTLRAVGILGPRPHDSGSLLAVLSVYWIASLLLRSEAKKFTFIFPLISVCGLLMTQTASNILVFCLGLFVIMLSYWKNNKSTTVLFLVAFVLVFFASFFMFNIFLDIKPVFLTQWLKRIGSNGAWVQMMSLGIEDFGNDLFGVFIGHGTSLGFSNVGNVSEVAFIKLLVELGLITWMIFIFTLTYPILWFISNKNVDKQLAMPYIGAIFTGLVSLWHYGTILRTTNIFVFFALYACALKLLKNAQGKKL